MDQVSELRHGPAHRDPELSGRLRVLDWEPAQLCRPLDPKKPQGNDVTASRDNTDRAPEDAPKPALGTFPRLPRVLSLHRKGTTVTSQSNRMWCIMRKSLRQSSVSSRKKQVPSGQKNKVETIWQERYSQRRASV